jgi:MFS family permease
VFGVFQTYYVDTLMPDQDASSIAWIGSIQLFFTTIGCLPGGLLLDRGYLKSIIAVGTTLEVVGLLLTSFFKGYWSILFSQGVCMGIGSGLLALIPVAILAMFFEKKRMIATGLASTGASIAGIAYSLSMRSLFISAGFAWAVRVLALVILGTNIIAFAVMRLQLQYGSKSGNFGLHHFKDWPYTIFVFAFALFVASSFVPFFFIQEYALQLGVSTEMAFNLLSIMNAANIFGRFVPNFIADRFVFTQFLQFHVSKETQIRWRQHVVATKHIVHHRPLHASPRKNFAIFDSYQHRLRLPLWRRYHNSRTNDYRSISKQVRDRRSPRVSLSHRRFWWTSW